MLLTCPVFCYLFIYLASPNKKTTHIHKIIIHKIIRQGDHYSLVNNSGSHVK